MANRISPFIKRLRVNGGSIYTFQSSVEDMGININERNNFVKISHFALLEIPNITESSTGYKNNTFNVRNIAGAWEYEQNSASVKDGRVLIAESFQNYALNLESNLLAQDTYNPQLTTTVSERVFWKWLKEIGTIRWNDPSIASNGNRYWNEEIDSNSYSSVVKYIGQVSAGNVRIDSFGTYNETYILVPTSHGQTRAYFKQVEDDNYYHGLEIGDGGENILGRDSYTKPHPDGLNYRAYYDFVDSSTSIGTTPYYTYYDNSTGTYIPGWWYGAEGIVPISISNAYLTDSSSYITDKIYNVDLKYQGPNTITFRRSKVDCVSLELDLNNLKTIYGDSTLSFDKMATDYQTNDSFIFNAVLIYYSVYNSTKDTVLATNLLGVMFLDAPSGNSSEIGTGLQGIQLPSLEKIASGVNGFGTSYSLRLNIKTDNMLDDTQATIIDESTSDQLWGEEWQTTFENLAIAVNTLTQQNATFNYISGQYVVLRENQTEILNRLIDLEYTVNDIGKDIKGTANTIALFADGDDPLLDSSIYMRYGRIGMFNNDPQWAVHIDASVKTLDITIENAIRDTSNNILLGYGSPLQLGSSTNFREVDIYTGQINPAIKVDISNNVNFNGDVSIIGKLEVDSSVIFKSSVIFESSIVSSYFDFSKTYMALPQNVGSGLTWDGTYLNIIPSSDVSAPGNPGDLLFTGVGGVLSSDSSSSIVWKTSTKRLGVGTSSPSTTAHIVGVLRVDGSILRNGVELSLNPGGSSTQIQINNAGSFYGSSNLTWNGSLNVIGNMAVSTITSTGNLTINSITAGGNLSFTNSANRNLYIGSGSTPRILTIYSNDQSSTTGNGGVTFIRGGNAGSSSGTGGDVSIYGGSGFTSGTGGKVNISGGGGSTGGNINILGGTAVNTGGNVFIYSGKGITSGNIYIEPKSGTTGGNVYINGGDGSLSSGNVYINGGDGSISGSNIYIAGGNGITRGGGIFLNGGNGTSTDGSISIGLSNTSYITLCPSIRIASLPTGTASGSEYLFVDTSDSNKIKRTSITITQPTVSWAGSVGSNNCIITANGDGSIVAETTLKYSPYEIRSSSSLIVGAADNSAGGTGGDLNLYAGDSNGTGGNINIQAGGILGGATGGGGIINIVSGSGGTGTSGDIFIYPAGSLTNGNLYLANNGSTDYGRSVFSSGIVSAPGISFRAQLGTGFYYATNQINVPFSGSNRFRFTSGGVFYAYNDIVSYYTSLSDIRLKENIKLLGPSLDKVLKLNGIEYNRKKNGEHHIGFIAQEVEKIIPEVVSEVETMEENGKYKSIRYDEIIPYLVESIKEQQKMINELKNEIVNLKNK